VDVGSWTRRLHRIPHVGDMQRDPSPRSMALPGEAVRHHLPAAYGRTTWRQAGRVGLPGGGVCRGRSTLAPAPIAGPGATCTRLARTIGGFPLLRINTRGP